MQPLVHSSHVAKNEKQSKCPSTEGVNDPYTIIEGHRMWLMKKNGGTPNVQTQKYIPNRPEHYAIK